MNVDALVARVLRDAGPGRPVVLIDGGSGAGKSTLAIDLAAGIGDCQLISLDSLYPGWYGLAAASAMVVADVLRADGPGYWGWDWQSNRRTGWTPLDPARPIVVEGCGALTPASAALATTSIWLSLAAGSRKSRALSRPDGPGFAPWWGMWERQEHAHWRAHHPAQLADIVVRADQAGTGSLVA